MELKREESNAGAEATLWQSVRVTIVAVLNKTYNYAFIRRVQFFYFGSAYV